MFASIANTITFLVVTGWRILDVFQSKLSEIFQKLIASRKLVLLAFSTNGNNEEPEETESTVPDKLDYATVSVPTELGTTCRNVDISRTKLAVIFLSWQLPLLYYNCL
jgi:hypothetical protein